ncbi:MAG: hypothetical protein IPL53_17130 [Ignavibacteria bacterium]|nr:hypothetical protein [Ignavibacteria bacterium]
MIQLIVIIERQKKSQLNRMPVTISVLKISNIIKKQTEIAKQNKSF